MSRESQGWNEEKNKMIEERSRLKKRLRESEKTLVMVVSTDFLLYFCSVYVLIVTLIPRVFSSDKFTGKQKNCFREPED